MKRVLLAIALCASIPVLADDPKPPGLSRSERKEAIARLDEASRQFLQDVEWIILDEERDLFLRLESVAQRERFIAEFWKRRDRPDRTPDWFRRDYYDRLTEAQSKYRNRSSDRFRIFMTQGRPVDIVQVTCHYLQPIEIWLYRERLPGTGSNPKLVFYTPRYAGDYRLWVARSMGEGPLTELLSPDGVMEGLEAVFYGKIIPGTNPPMRDVPLLERSCGGNARLVLDATLAPTVTGSTEGRLFTPPPPSAESSRSYLSSAVIRTPGAPQLPAVMSVRHPSRRGDLTESELTVLLDGSAIKALAAPAETKVELMGEVLREDRFFEGFRYRFDVPADVPATLPVTVSRFLRPGAYTIRMKAKYGTAEALVEQAVQVPAVAGDAQPASVAASGGEPAAPSTEVLRILPITTEGVSGFRLIETTVAGSAVKSVEFYLDGTKVMTKRAAPYSVELDFGNVPRPHVVKVLAKDAAGNVIGGDEIRVNEGLNRLRVRIVSPRFAVAARGTARFEADVFVPAGQKLERLEVFVGADRVVTLFEPPFVHPITLSGDPSSFVRAVAYLEGSGEQVEDVVLLNRDTPVEQVTVQLVEIPAVVLREGRPVLSLTKEAFRVFDGEKPAEVARFETLSSQPLSIGIVVDSSESMRSRLPEVEKAIGEFMRSVFREKDRAFLVGFDRTPRVLQNWTANATELTKAVQTINASNATALYDALVFSLYRFQNIEGQKALLVLTDGADTASSYRFDQLLEYARRSGVPVYPIAIGMSRLDVDLKMRLSKLAAESGGLLIQGDTSLVQAFKDIETELRSQYLLAITPSAEGKEGTWRGVRVDVDGAKVRARSGYYK